MYQMYLLLGGTEIQFPVLPEVFALSAAGKNETVEVLELGEVNLLQKKGLREISFDSFFPRQNAPYVTGYAADPSGLVKTIEAFRDSKEPGRFLLLGEDWNVNLPVGVESFDYEERGGEVGDIYYSIKLKEWKDYSPRRLQLTPYIVVEYLRSGSSPDAAAGSHTVVKGDCLWSIAQKFYGDGSRYPELYEKNKAVIDAGNKGTGNPRYTIYPGQVLYP